MTKNNVSDKKPSRNSRHDDAHIDKEQGSNTDFDIADLERSSADQNGVVPNPFDVDSLRISQDFSTAVGVKKAILTVPVRKPSKEWFVRTHPDEEFRLTTAVIDLKEERETYLVAPSLRCELAGESTFAPRMLVTTINRQGVVFLWPLRLPGPDGKFDEWGVSALEAADLAREKWVRVQANMSLGAFEVMYAETATEPEWPDLDFNGLLRVAFRDRFIDSLDHPVLKQLRGEV